MDARFFVEVLAAALAALAFGILFQVPKKQYFYTAFAAGIAWACYLLSMKIYPSPTLASFVSTAVLTVICRVFAVKRKTPVTVFLLCALFPIVPGAGIYYTAYNFIMGINDLALAKGIETIKCAVAIALAVVFTFSLPNEAILKLARIGQKSAKQPAK